MRTLGNNMVWLLKSIEAGKEAGVALPEQETLYDSIIPNGRKPSS